MAKCIYCEQDVGWFHKECVSCKNKRKATLKKEQGRVLAMKEEISKLGKSYDAEKYLVDASKEVRAIAQARKEELVAIERDASKQGMIELVRSSILTNINKDVLGKNLEEIAEKNGINREEIKDIIIAGWESTLSHMLEDNIISEDEEKKHYDALEKLNLTQADLNKKGMYTKLAQCVVLREILNGNIPNVLKIDGGLPFNFKKNEKLVWLFQGVEHLNLQTRKQYVGGSVGASVRVAKGFYLRTSSFRGEPVYTKTMVSSGKGQLAVTNMSIYFTGGLESFRIPYDKIVSFKPYSDGIGFQKATASAVPEAFIVGDGWFIYNLITNLASLSKNSE